MPILEQYIEHVLNLLHIATVEICDIVAVPINFTPLKNAMFMKCVDVTDLHRI